MSKQTKTCCKQQIEALAASYGTTTTYSGAAKTMFINGADAVVKTVLRMANFAGKKEFTVKQGQTF